MNNKASQPPAPPKKFRFTGSHAATAAMFLIVLFMWRDLSRTKTAMEGIRAENLRVGEKLVRVESDLTAKNKELDQFKTGDSRSAGGSTTAKKNPAETSARRDQAVKTPVEEPETLFLQDPTVTENNGALTVRFQFKPEEGVALPDQVTLVARVPSDSSVKILSLEAVEAPAYSNVRSVVSPQGTLGMIEGSPSDLKALEFELTVSAPIKATVRGSQGIRAFEIDITPSGCAIRKL